MPIHLKAWICLCEQSGTGMDTNPLPLLSNGCKGKQYQVQHLGNAKIDCSFPVPKHIHWEPIRAPIPGGWVGKKLESSAFPLVESREGDQIHCKYTKGTAG